MVTAHNYLVGLVIQKRFGLRFDLTEFFFTYLQEVLDYNEGDHFKLVYDDLPIYYVPEALKVTIIFVYILVSNFTLDLTKKNLFINITGKTVSDG